MVKRVIFLSMLELKKVLTQKQQQRQIIPCGIIHNCYLIWGIKQISINFDRGEFLKLLITTIQRI